MYTSKKSQANARFTMHSSYSQQLMKFSLITFLENTRPSSGKYSLLNNKMHAGATVYDVSDIDRHYVRDL